MLESHIWRYIIVARNVWKANALEKYAFYIFLEVSQVWQVFSFIFMGENYKRSEHNDIQKLIIMPIIPESVAINIGFKKTYVDLDWVKINFDYKTRNQVLI